MFYLIDEKDEFFNGKLLVNALNLETIEVATNGKPEVVFRHFNDENMFAFNESELFNVDEVIQNISELTPEQYSNPFIVVTDQQNIDFYSHDSKIRKKVSKILVNIESIGIVYEKDYEYILTTKNQNFTIKESPEEVFFLIQEKIINNNLNNTDSVESKSSLKHKM